MIVFYINQILVAIHTQPVLNARFRVVQCVHY